MAEGGTRKQICAPAQTDARTHAQWRRRPLTMTPAHPNRPLRNPLLSLPPPTSNPQLPGHTLARTRGVCGRPEFTRAGRADEGGAAAPLGAGPMPRRPGRVRPRLPRAGRSGSGTLPFNRLHATWLHCRSPPPHRLSAAWLRVRASGALLFSRMQAIWTPQASLPQQAPPPPTAFPSRPPSGYAQTGCPVRTRTPDTLAHRANARTHPIAQNQQPVIVTLSAV